MASSSPARHLSGQYKDFFDTSAHPTVENWYLHVATPDLRNKMKSLVTKIIAFDFAKAKASLRTTYDPNIIKANAIFEKNNGPSIISKNICPSAASSPTTTEASSASTGPVTYQQKTVQWLSFASVVEQNQFRETIGLMVPPNRFSTHRHNDDFDPQRKYWKTESQIAEHKSLVCGDLLHKPSDVFDIECETIGRHKTQTGTQFSWKTATSRASLEEKIGGTFTSVSQRAHDSTYKGAPWGVYGTPGDVNANKTQWVSQTKEDFQDTFFLQNKKDRRFQNYNDNYIGLLSKHYTDQQKAERQMLKSSKANDSNHGTSAAFSAALSAADRTVAGGGKVSPHTSHNNTNTSSTRKGLLPTIGKR